MNLRQDWILLAVLILPLFAANLLPPDTSLKTVHKDGGLSVCVPESYPPLVQANAEYRGIDVELVQAIAQEMKLQVRINPNPAMGRDVNPRNWRVTRAQCQVLAGGLVDNLTTRAFLERTPAYLETGWALARPDSTTSIRGKTVGFFTGISGLDRIALGQFLRAQGAEVVSVPTIEEFVSGIGGGRFAAGVTESLILRSLAFDQGWKVEWLPKELGRFPVVMGLWKGDLTLKRAVVRSLEQLRRSGKLGEILSRYTLAGISEKCSVCTP